MFSRKTQKDKWRTKTELCSRFPTKSIASPERKAQEAAASTGSYAGDIRPWHLGEMCDNDLRHSG